jgi:hypothetical protein
MSTDAKRFPKFKELESARKEVIQLTPIIANRPETPVLAYYLALGIEAANNLQVASEKTNGSRSAAAKKAAASQAQTLKGGERTGKRNTKLSESEQEADDTIAAYHRRRIY